MVWYVQLLNQINARKINDELNVFSRLIHSHLFMYIWIAEAGLQVHDAMPEPPPSPLSARCLLVHWQCFKIALRISEVKHGGAPR